MKRLIQSKFNAKTLNTCNDWNAPSKNIRKTHTHNIHGHKANSNLTTRQEREALTQREFFFVFIEMKNEMEKKLIIEKWYGNETAKYVSKCICKRGP